MGAVKIINIVFVFVVGHCGSFVLENSRRSVRAICEEVHRSTIMASQRTTTAVPDELIGLDIHPVDDVTFADLFTGDPRNIPQAILESLVTFQTNLVVETNDVTPLDDSVSCQLQGQFQPSGQTVSYSPLTSPSKQIFDLICIANFEDSSKETNLEDSGNISDFQQESSTSDDSLEVDSSTSAHQQQQLLQQQQPQQHQSFDAVSPVIYSDFTSSPVDHQQLLPHQLYTYRSIQPVPACPTPPQQQQAPVYREIQYLNHVAPKPPPVMLLPKPEIADLTKVQSEPETYYSDGRVVHILPAPASEKRPEAESTDSQFVIKKKTRTSYTMKQIRALERIFLDTPYPDTEKIETISVELDISEQKLRIWFQNKRARWRKRTKDNETSSNPVYLPPLSLAGKLRSQQLDNLPPTSYSLTSRAVASLHHLSSADQNKQNTSRLTPTCGIPSAIPYDASDLLVTPPACLGMTSSYSKSGNSPYQHQFFSGRDNGNNSNSVHHRMTNTLSPLNIPPMHSTRNLMMQNSYVCSPSDSYRSTSCSVPMTSTPHYGEGDCYFYQPRVQNSLHSYYDQYTQKQYGSYTPSFGFM